METLRDVFPVCPAVGMLIWFIVLADWSFLSQLASNQDGPERAENTEAEHGTRDWNFALTPVWKPLKEARWFPGSGELFWAGVGN